MNSSAQSTLDSLADLTTSIRVGLLDYGSGNLRSVAKALETVGAHVSCIESGPIPEDLRAVVLPGVGSFGDSVRQLHARRLFSPVQSWLAAERPFLGICLGYQLLFEASEESPGIAGLGHFSGSVRRFTPGETKVPQIGWNIVRWKSPIGFPGLPEQSFVYFNHSYYPVPLNSAIVAGETDYGIEFAAAIAQGKLLATQFHPEKSQQAGLTILRAFIDRIS